MVNRKNYLLVQAHLEYLHDVAQLSEGTISRYRFLLKHLLLWADEIHLAQAHEVRPSYPAFLRSSRLDGGKGSLAPTTLVKAVRVAKRLLRWAKLTRPLEFKSLPGLWIDSLKAPRVPQTQTDHQFVSLEEVKTLASYKIPEDDLASRRDQAAACMLFLSGMRGSAFCSTPINAIDLSSLTIRQWPSLGVRTKMGKSETTYLLRVPELLECVKGWDRLARPRLPETAMWYAPTVSRWGDQVLSAEPPGKNRVTSLAKRMRKLFVAAGLPYKSPHKFRHGHAVFALQHSRTMADYKAVSMNLMHSDIKVTDGIYAPLAGQEVRQRIASLTGDDNVDRPAPAILEAAGTELSRQEVAERLMDLARRLAA
ncbi:MAG: tyrosine-type recombinase/integrase [Anaerolineales bacterium]